MFAGIGIWPALPPSNRLRALVRVARCARHPRVACGAAAAVSAIDKARPPPARGMRVALYADVYDACGLSDKAVGHRVSKVSGGILDLVGRSPRFIPLELLP
jgi:hypothetical protein